MNQFMFFKFATSTFCSSRLLLLLLPFCQAVGSAFFTRFMTQVKYNSYCNEKKRTAGAKKKIQKF